jgi:hypothetical protein
MNLISANPKRRAMRRAAATRCHAVSSQAFELLGERALDLSPRGMLIACDAPAALGEEVIVSFVAPGAQPLWLDAEAEITRIVHGLREGDPGYCIGLHFKYFERSSRAELLARLAGCPPPVPRRRPPLSSVRVASGNGGVAGPEPVRLLPSMRVWPTRGLVPAGVFRA